MVEYMKQFLSEFAEPPYIVEKENRGSYRITNTFSGISRVVRGNKGCVFMEELKDWGDGSELVWIRIIGPKRLRETLGITGQ